MTCTGQLKWSTIATTSIWLIGCGILIALTIRDFIPLYNDYTYNNVYAKTEVKRDAIPRPDVVVCLPYYSDSLTKIVQWLESQYSKNGSSSAFEDCMECAALAENGWNVWAELKMPEEWEFWWEKRVEGMLVEAILKKLLDEAGKGDIEKLVTLNRTNFNWNQPIIDAILYFMSAMQELDHVFLGWPTLENAELNEFFNLTAVDFESPAIKLLRNFALRAWTVYVNFYTAGENEHILTNEIITDPLEGREVSVNTNNLCFTLLKNFTVETFMYNPFEDPSDPPWERYKGRVFAVVKSSSGFYSAATPQILYRTNRLQAEQTRYEQVTLMYSAMARVAEERPNVECSRNQNAALCSLEKQIEVALKDCGCVPYTHSHMYETPIEVPFCNFKHYNSCEALQKNMKPAYDYCNNKCETIFYSWMQDSDVGAQAFADSPKSLLLSVSVLGTMQEGVPMLHFTLTIRDSLEKFISQIGGIVNLYVGVSGVTVCGILVFTVNALQKMSERRKENKIDPNAFRMDDQGVEDVLKQMMRKIDDLTARMDRYERRQ